MEEVDTFAIETRHRKEKKELQAKIQELKKTAKNDKSKKKEVSAEITRLELDLLNRHKVELESVVQQELEPEIEEELETQVSKVKLSKAQKRRDKKSQHDKNREEQIKIQEKENIYGPRNTEMQAINAKLKKINFKIFPIPSDGDCLYNAVAHQLLTKTAKSISVDELRKSVSSHIKQNKDDFIPFMSNPNTLEMVTDGEFEEYCDKIVNTKVWGGQLEIRALSSCLKSPISVVQATGPDTIEQGSEFEGPALVISYHRHMYSLGEHYNSTCPEDNDQEDEPPLLETH